MLDFKDIKIVLSEEEVLKDGKLRATVEVYPLPRGYGHTLGTALRRVLLSSIPGYAITSVRINDIDHEFTTIPGVLENVLEIVLKMKKIRFKVNGSMDSYVITLNHTGKAKDIVAGDFKTPADVEIVNKDYKIATVTDDKADLNIEAVIELGYGYNEPDENLRSEVGRIPLDAIYGPVKLVTYEVFPVSKQGKVEFDRLVMRVETDGSVTVRTAVEEGLEILKRFFESLAENLTGEPRGVLNKVMVDEERTESEAMVREEATHSITELKLSKRIINNLRSNGFNTVEELLKINPADFVRLKGIGAESAKQIEKALEEFKKKLS